MNGKSHDNVRYHSVGYQSRIQETMDKWRNTNLQVIISPILHFAASYPITTFFLGILLAFSALPIMIFLTFIVSSFLLTLFGFFILEGTFVTLAVVLISIAVFVCFSIASVITVAFVTGWISLSQTWKVFQSIKSTVVPQKAKIKESEDQD